MKRSWKNFKTNERATLRAQRITSAGLLLTQVPRLIGLNIEIRQHRQDSWADGSVYMWRFALPHAPALFEIPCSYDRCEGGLYDITREVISALSASRPTFEGDRTCDGQCGPGPCPRQLHYSAVATYAPAPLEDAISARR